MSFSKLATQHVSWLEHILAQDTILSAWTSIVFVLWYICTLYSIVNSTAFIVASNCIRKTIQLINVSSKTIMFCSNLILLTNKLKSLNWLSLIVITAEFRNAHKNYDITRYATFNIFSTFKLMTLFAWTYNVSVYYSSNPIASIHIIFTLTLTVCWSLRTFIYVNWPQ